MSGTQTWSYRIMDGIHLLMEDRGRGCGRQLLSNMVATLSQDGCHVHV